MFCFSVSQFPSMPANFQVTLINGFDIHLLRYGLFLDKLTKLQEHVQEIMQSKNSALNHRSIPRRYWMSGSVVATNAEKNFNYALLISTLTTKSKAQNDHVVVACMPSGIKPLTGPPHCVPFSFLFHQHL
jgi:hypothetical protein